MIPSIGNSGTGKTTEPETLVVTLVWGSGDRLVWTRVRGNFGGMGIFHVWVGLVDI